MNCNDMDMLAVGGEAERISSQKKIIYILSTWNPVGQTKKYL